MNEKPSESEIIAPENALLQATNFANDLAKFLDEEFMEQLDIVSLIRDTKTLFEMYSSDDGSFLGITKSVCESDLRRFSSDNSQLYFDDDELKQWLKSCEEALFNVIVGTLAERIYKTVAERHGEKAVLENIKRSKDPEAEFLMKKAKDNFIFFLENILKQQFRNVIQISINTIKNRVRSEKAIKYLN